MTLYSIRSLTAADQAWLTNFFLDQWGSTRQVVRGAIFLPHELPGFVAETADGLAGVITYRFLDDNVGEVATLNSLQEGVGIGGALVRAVVEEMQQNGRSRLIVVTTNDNLPALRFYQKQGFVLTTLRANALAGSRQLKPEIPLVGRDNIPLRDEIELTRMIDERGNR